MDFCWCMIFLLCFSAEIAKNIPSDCFALVFGINTFISLLFQSFLTATFNGKGGFEFDPRKQVYISFFFKSSCVQLVSKLIYRWKLADLLLKLNWCQKTKSYTLYFNLILLLYLLHSRRLFKICMSDHNNRLCLLTFFL